MRKVQAEIHVHTPPLPVQHWINCANFHEDLFCSTLLDLLYRSSPNKVRKLWKYGKKLVYIRKSIFTKFTLARQLSVQNTCTESHENPTDGLVAQPRLRTDGCTGSSGFLLHKQCLNMTEIRNNNTVLVGKHEWNR